MQPSGRLSAAIEVLAEIEARHRPAGEALADWGKAHRFAGSGDRSAIGNLVFDALRQRASIAWSMGTDSPRGLTLGTLAFVWGLSLDEIGRWAEEGEHASGPLSEAERRSLSSPNLDDAPDWVRGDIPEWLGGAFADAFGARCVEEGAALGRRAPIDLRVNTLKANRGQVQKALQRHGAGPTPLSPVGLRIAQKRGPTKSPNVEAEAAHGKGWFEVQDEGSQLAALLSGAGPKLQVLDLCAGAGGKTLALAAAMRNTGQLYAYDADRLRLRPIFDRLQRAGARSVQVLAADDVAALAPLQGRMDIVLIDAPCSGSGVWRRRPDAKWRIKPVQLEARLAEQAALLDQAAELVKPGGRIAYVTCSVLPAENNDQVAAFLSRRPDFATTPWQEVWRATLNDDPPASSLSASDALQLTPARHGTDGFYVATLTRSA